MKEKGVERISFSLDAELLQNFDSLLLQTRQANRSEGVSLIEGHDLKHQYSLTITPA